MKIACHCGCTIFDQTDALPHKAHLIPDPEWNALADAIDEGVIAPLTAGKLDADAAAMKVRMLLSRVTRSGWQCTNCGRLFIDDQRHDLQCYAPVDDETAKDLFRSRS